MPKVLIVNPRGLHYGDRHATSIDLTVRVLIMHSRFRDGTTVIGDPIDHPFDQPFDGIAYVTRPIGRSDHFYFRIRRLLAALGAIAPDVSRCRSISARQVISPGISKPRWCCICITRSDNPRTSSNGAGAAKLSPPSADR